jgi:hypothetical protein
LVGLFGLARNFKGELMKSMKAIFTALLLLASAGAQAAPEKFQSVDQMMEEFGDFTKEKNGYELISKSPLHIRLSALTMPADSVDSVNTSNQRALVYGVYRTFINTNVDKVTVTAIPAQVTLDGKNKRPHLLSDIKLIVTKTRQQAMQDISRFMKIKSMNELVDQDDFWTEQFENEVYYNKAKLPQLVKVMTSNK